MNFNKISLPTFNHPKKINFAVKNYIGRDITLYYVEL